jgi:hypothetical protein
VSFSQRFGFKPAKTAFQKNSMDKDLRVGLWNALNVIYWESVTTDGYSNQRYLSGYANERFAVLCKRLWHLFYKRPLDTLSDNWHDVYQEIREQFFQCEWFEVYDLIEFIAQNYPDENDDHRNRKFTEFCNRVLEQELSIYRFVGHELAPITDDREITAIDDALKIKISPVRQHLEKALQKVSDRKNPDYRNSIKESISAVEALVKKVTASEKGTLGQVIKALEQQTTLHPALRAAFEKLYGYTSDADGIRHALLDDDRVTFEEAKFMLVACSAFTNYVTATLSK